MKNIFRWYVGNNTYAYLYPINNEGKLDPSGSYFSSEDFDLSTISDVVSGLTETEYEIAFDNMAKMVREKPYNKFLYPYNYYYNIDKNNVNIIYGVQGPQGSIGFNGAQGFIGAQGEKGNQGERGSQGPKGNDAYAKNVIGSYSAVVFICADKSDEIPSKPDASDGDYDFTTNVFTPPIGWQVSPSFDVFDSSTQVIYRSTKSFLNGHDNSETEWSNVLKVNGANGEDSETDEYIYTLSKTLKDEPTAPKNNKDVKGFVPTSEGWHDKRQAVDDTNKYCWSCYRSLTEYYKIEEGETIYIIEPDGALTTDDGTKHWSKWYGPYVDSHWGDKGADGDGVEYIFTTGMTTNSEGEIQAPIASDTGNSRNFSEDDWYGLDSTGREWTDNPVELSTEALYQFVCYRKRKNGVWGKYNDPVLWNAYISTTEKGTTLNVLEGAYYEDKNELDGATNLSEKTLILKDGNDTVHNLSIGDIVYAQGKAYIWDGDSWCGPVEGTGNYLHIKYAKEYDSDEGYVFTDASNVLITDEDFKKEYIAYKEDGKEFDIIIDGHASKYQWQGEYLYEIISAGESSDGAKYIGMCLNNDVDDPTAYTSYQWTKFVGDDGFGVEYIFTRTNDYEPPIVPGYQTIITTNGDGTQSTTYKHKNQYYYYDGDGILQNVGSANTIYQTADFVPVTYDYDNGEPLYEWTDDPQGVSSKEGEKYEWQVTRKKGSDGWTAFKGATNTPYFATLKNNFAEATNGSNAPIIYYAGEYEDGVIYTRDANKAPFVKYIDSETFEEGYYLLIKSYEEGTTDYPYPTDTTYWEKMTSYSAVITKVLIADNALVGGAVFNGHFMFSKYGVNSKGEDCTEDEYKNFFRLDPYYETKRYMEWYDLYYAFMSCSTDSIKDTEYYKAYEEYDEAEVAKYGDNRQKYTSIPDAIFKPNWCVDLYTGKMWMNHGLASVTENEFSISANTGDLLFRVDDGGNLDINGNIYKNKTTIDTAHRLYSNFSFAGNGSGQDGTGNDYYWQVADDNVSTTTKQIGHGNDKVSMIKTPVLVAYNNFVGSQIFSSYPSHECSDKDTTYLSLDIRNSDNYYVFNYNLSTTYIVIILPYLFLSNKYEEIDENEIKSEMDSLWHEEYSEEHPGTVYKYYYYMAGNTPMQIKYNFDGQTLKRENLSIAVSQIYKLVTHLAFNRTFTRIGGEKHYCTMDDIISIVGNKLIIENRRNYPIYIVNTFASTPYASNTGDNGKIEDFNMEATRLSGVNADENDNKGTIAQFEFVCEKETASTGTNIPHMHLYWKCLSPADVGSFLHYGETSLNEFLSTDTNDVTYGSNIIIE